MAGIISLLMAAGYFAIAFHIVFSMRIGPTAVTVSEANGWGAHTGDALALPVALLGVLSLVFAVYCRVHGAGQRVEALIPEAARAAS